MDGLRTNVFHLPVMGNGDGGIYSTAADFSALWDSLFVGRIVSLQRFAEMVRPHSAWAEGYDAGVSFARLHQPSPSITYSVVSNWSTGAWPNIRLLEGRLGS